MILKPEIKIRFKLDPNGKPQVIHHNGIDHFKIEIFADKIPDDVYAVNYQLHESYINSFREEREKRDSFKFSTTAYGDYNLVASFLGKKQNYLNATLVSQALAKEHEDDLQNPFIKEAIEKVRSN